MRDQDGNILEVDSKKSVVNEAANKLRSLVG